MKYHQKDELILSRCSGKSVLHLGCVGTTDAQTDEKVSAAPSTLHMKLSSTAKVTGVDLCAEAVEAYRSLGICDNILVGDVEKLDDLGLKPEFDIIVIGDLIEHLSNPGHMLDGVRRLCRADTTVLLTTPHAFGFAPFLRHLTGKFREGRQHVMTFNEQNLTNLVERHGFAMAEVGTCYQPQSAHGAAFHIGKFLFRTYPHLGGTLFCVLKPTA
jgi:2-polyprenyl-3-methyl-5-hydroxy-6-metoxy-1,4-benzoquinol methylase